MELRVAELSSGQADEKNIKVSEVVFGQSYNESLIHQVLTAYMAGGRAGTKAQKTRAEVSGGGIKPWRQKGTGRARAGTIRSPLWRKGGKSFAAVPRDFKQKVNRKMYEGAMRSIWSELVRQNRLIVLDDFTLTEPKTRGLLQKLALLKVERVLIIHDNIDRNLLLAARNLYKVQLCPPEAVNPAILIAFEQVLVTVNALKHIEEKLQ
jgi:large subunit ribosomal protein L4